MRRLFQYLGKYKTNLSTAIGASIINKGFDLMPPILTAWLIDAVSGNTPGWIYGWTGLIDPWRIVIFLAILTFTIHLFESLFEWIYKIIFMRLAQHVQHDLRLDAYNKMQQREMAFFESQRTGNLMAIVNDDVNQLERFLNSSFNKIIQLFILVIFAGFALLQVSVPLGLVAMIPLPFIVLGSVYYQRKIAPYYREVRSSVGDLSNRLENNISGMAVIKSFTAEWFETKRVKRMSAKYRNSNFKAIGISSLYIPLIRILVAIGFTSTLFIGCYWVINGINGFTLGSLAFFAMMIQRLLWPMTELGQVFDDFERARASSRRIFGLLDAPQGLVEDEETKKLSKLNTGILFKNVEFFYQKNQPVLKDISLNVPVGNSLGIAGSTGGGKTTVIKLLLRFYDITSGQILIDGQDIRKLKITELRRAIAYVSQEVYMFHGSIRENIAYGMPEASLEEIIQASHLAQLDDFVQRLPEKYDTIVGEKGIKLSGGQRQRLSIARAILKDAPILVLDEATSAVDTETERAIQKSLEELTKDRTSIIIAHRLSTIRNCDQIIVIEQGNITEQGKHQSLLDKGGVYADLWNIQTGAYIK